MSEPRRGWPLRPTLLTVVVVLIFAGAGGVGVIAYRSSRAIIERLWRDLADQLATATTQRTLRYFAPAPPYVALTLRQAAAGRLPLGPFDGSTPPADLLDYFHAAVEANPAFSWASFGAADGTYVAVYRRPDGALRGVWRTARPGKPTVMRELAREGERRWRVLGRSEGTYTPVGRPWYRAALAKGAEGGVWVEPFVFATVKQPGFMFARAYRPARPARASASQPAGTTGVFAVEYETSALSRFLAKLRVGERGRVYIVTRGGEVVGHPRGETTETAAGKLRVARAAEHPDRMLREAWRGLLAHGVDKPGRFRVGPYLAMADPFPADTGIDWRVLVVVPEDDFFGDLRSRALQTLIVALVAALLAVFFGAMFSNRVSTALRAIAVELERVGRFDLEGRVLERRRESFVREVNEMRDTTLRMKRSLRSFGKYVPKELVRELIVSGAEAELGGRRAELTVLFSDIADFTSATEKLSPDALVEILGEYLQGMSEAIRAANGTVDKYIGDAIMAFWGAPGEDADHAIAACRGALAMQARLRELRGDWVRRGLPPFHTRVGVNSGEMLVGNFGAPERLNYTVMGDPVNLASRLEALNKQYGTGILLGERTAELLRDAFVLRPIDFVAVKGKDQAVRVFELLGERDDVDADTRAAAERYAEALTHYRAREFAEARAIFDELAKTRDDEAARRLAARCAEYEHAPPPEGWDGRTTMTEK